MTNETCVQEFYSKIQFPGPYLIEDLEFYDTYGVNRYLRVFDDAVQQKLKVLDIGCGSGFIVNFLARRHPEIQFTAVDFGNGIDYAKKFSQDNQISNITFYKENFLTWESKEKYDLIICNGVLHHIPEYLKAVDKIKQLSSGDLVIGIYNTYGKLYKKLFAVNYRSNVLFQDQEHCPFEVSFTNQQFLSLFLSHTPTKIHPSIDNRMVDFVNLFNYSNGGLTLYCLSPG